MAVSIGSSKSLTGSSSSGSLDASIKRIETDSRHDYICDIVASFLSLDKREILDYFVRSEQVFSLSSFFLAGGSNHLLVTLPKTSYRIKSGCSDRSKRTSKVNSLVVTSDGECPPPPPPLGTSVFFIKWNIANAVPEDSVTMSLNCGLIESGENEILPYLRCLMEMVFVPSVVTLESEVESWGDLMQYKVSKMLKRRFLSSVHSLVATLGASEESLSKIVGFQAIDSDVLEKVQCVITRLEVLPLVDNTIATWIQCIQKAITESEEVRQDSDSLGPSAELQYWKTEEAKIGSLLQEIETPENGVKTLMTAVCHSRPRRVKMWKQLERKLHQMHSLAAGNVRYLQVLDKHCSALYLNNPEDILETLPEILGALHMVYRVSEYFQQPDKIASLVIKVTNQMILACKVYLRSDNDWRAITKLAINGDIICRLQLCTRLGNEYQSQFKALQERILVQENCSMNFSQVLAFGKLISACNRFENIVKLFETIRLYTALFSSAVQGLLEPDDRELKQMTAEFNEAVTYWNAIPYDILNHVKKDEFDKDYAEFMQHINSLQVQLTSYLTSQLAPCWQMDHAIYMLKRVEQLNLPQYPLIERKLDIINAVLDKVLDTGKQYDAYKDNPPIARNMPPISGKMQWSIGLLAALESRMFALKDYSDLLEQPKSKELIGQYNRVAKTLYLYASMYHQRFSDKMIDVHSLLNRPLLGRIPETRQLYVNFHLDVVLEEGRNMMAMGFTPAVPLREIMRKMECLRSNRDCLLHLVGTHYHLKQRIRPELQLLFTPHLAAVEKVADSGLSLITWASLNVDTFVDNLQAAVSKLETLIERTNSLCLTRIEDEVNSLADVAFIHVPTEDPITNKDFLEQTKVLCMRAAKILWAKNCSVEDAVNDLLDLLQDSLLFQEDLSQGSMSTEEEESEPQGYDLMRQTRRRSSMQSTNLTLALNRRHSTVFGNNNRPESIQRHRFLLRKRLKDAAQDVLRHYVVFYVEKLVSVIAEQLSGLYKELVPRGVPGRLARNGVIVVTADLCDANIVVRPSLKHIQETLRHATGMILSMFKVIPLWSRRRGPKVREVPSDFCQDDSGKSLTYVRPICENPNVLEVKATVEKNFYSTISENLEVVRVVSLLNTIADESLSQEAEEVLKRFSIYSHLWEIDCSQTIQEFMDKNPNLPEIETRIVEYREEAERISKEDDVLSVGGIVIKTDELKNSLLAESQCWTSEIVRACKEKYLREMDELLTTIGDLNRRLSRPIRDLDDVRFVMNALQQMRETEVDTELRIVPVEECFSMIGGLQLGILKEESEKVDNLRYNWQKLRAQSADVGDLLQEIYPHFHDNLLTDIDTFKADCGTFYIDYAKRGPIVPDLAPKEAYERVTTFQNRVDVMWRRFQANCSGEELFGMCQSEHPELARIRKEINLLQKLYKLYGDVTSCVQGYYATAWSEVDVEAINNELMEFQNRCRKLPKGLKEWPAFFEAKKIIDDFNELCPLLELMANKAMKMRHWKRISEVLNYPLDVDSESCTLKSVLEAPLLKFKEDIEDICISAVKEKDIEAKLKLVTNEWEFLQLSFSTFKNRGELLLRGDSTAEIVAKMEDSLVILGSLLNNRYNAPFRKKIQNWVTYLSNTSEVLEKWLLVQNLWVYLEAVFVGGDIANQLPKEAARFYTIDKSWQKVMQRAHEIPNVVQCCVGDEVLKQLLPHLESQLELCQRSLSGYLEKKRYIFPRFFFVSDPALLEILGQSSDSHTIQSHLLSIFDNTKSVAFHDQDYDRILSVVSSEGELIKLERPVRAVGSVELWLTQLLKTSQDSMHSIIRQAAQSISEPNFKLLDFLANYPAQVGILGLQMVWTRDAETAIIGGRQDRKVMFDTNNRFLDMLNSLIEKTTQDLQKFERTKYETLITIHVHQRDIFDQLCRVGIRSLMDFEWQKQCRFYFKEETDKTLICITDVTFTYQNEFLGCTDRLVITPLTDRCYITLAQALRMSMGGCSAGPAGTGKTETVKDMGKTLGKYVVLFNCSDQMDYRGLGRIFKGLAQSGSWGCFDEFNRIDLPVLSVAAQQIACLLLCKKEHRAQFVFTDGDTVKLNPEFGVFLTMNPGYAGRKELPENLKIQFRTVAMIIPDRQIIIRVKLASCGFLENITLARKFYALYKLCEEQLSKQVHYDFGLRNILSVLRTLGAAKKSKAEDTETTIVMRVLRDMNLSKLVDEDEPLFMSLINDLFPNNVLDKVQYPQLEEAIRHQVELAGLIYHEPWVLKIIQLYETQQVRHGIMTLGPTGSGKTTCIHTLMKAMTECGFPHQELRMNPKALTSSQMFGKLDVSTNDWTDGVFAALWRKTLKPLTDDDHTWLVLDGPVDSMWIENLNSVLDDNRMLTLVNGDRIPMAPTCKVIFEAHNIDNASPATVSRNGMVYMSSSVLGWQPILQAWITKCRPNQSQEIRETFGDIFPDLYQWSVQNLKFQIDVLECHMVNQLLTLLEGLLPELEAEAPPDVDSTAVDENTTMKLQRLFIFCIMWSFGALLEINDRRLLESHLQSLSTESKIFDLPTLLSTSDTIFNYFVDKSGEWTHWEKNTEDNVCAEVSSNNPDYGSVLVPHIDSVRTEFLVHTIAKQGKAVLLVGAQGTAKSVILKSYMKKYNSEVHLGKMVNFSSATTPYQFQKVFESLLEKRQGNTYGPPYKRKMTLFIDDLNLPMYNEWGDQPANEIVRQTIEMNGFYSLEKPGEFSTIVDVQFLAAMMQPGGGRNDIPSRLKRYFAIINCTLPSDECIDKIFGAIGSSHYCSKRGFSTEVQEFVPSLVACTRILWQRTKETLLPTPANFHYIFNLRDLSRIWQGIVGTLSNVITNKRILISLWKHECCRVIADRFTSVEDVKWFESTIVKVVEEQLGERFVAMVTPTDHFVDFLRDAPEPTGEEGEELDMEQPKVYEPIESFESLRERLTMFLTQYNEMVRGSGMDLVFFQDAMSHLVKVSRIIRNPGGNALLVGVGGSGKQSLSKLASFIAGYKTFQITLTRSYGLANLLEDLKVLFRTTGSQGKGTTFIFSEQDIKEEAFLEYLNSLLSAGTVYNLFNKEDQSEIITELTAIMKREFPRRPPTPENVLDFFATRVYQNLHVVLCFSPVGEKFRNRCLKFPGLVSGCTMDWYQPWPRDALVAVSSHLLSNFSVICGEDAKQQLILCMGSIQEFVAIKCSEYYQRYRRSFHVTPKTYLTFLNTYRNLYSEKQREIDQLAERMDSGLAKLQEASESVARLKVELDKMELELVEASNRAENVLSEVTERASEAEAIRNQVQKSADVAQVIVNEISVEKAIAEEKLEAARPALAEAEAALNTIKPAHIATVRKLGRPPHLIMRVMDCVLLLFQRRVQPVKEDPVQACPKPSWAESLKMMSHTNFLQMLQTFPKDTINDETVEFLEPYITMEDYNMETARRVCGDVAGLLSWTKAMVVFYDVNKEVLPLKANLAIQESRLKIATNELHCLEEDLLDKEKQLAEVKLQYEVALGSKQKLVEETRQCRHKMDTASMLISGLAGEKKRWTEESKDFKEKLGRLVGDVLYLTAFLTYAGPFNQEFRSILLNYWESEIRQRTIPMTDNFSVLNMLMDASLVAEWILQGLPSDELSVQNGLIVSKASCYPLLIDPQGQGQSWIKNKEVKNELQITSLSHKYFRTHLEDSLSLGRPLLIEDVGEELDPVLDNLLEKNFIKSGSTLKVMLGDKECDVMPGFTLYITTKLPNPQYAPEVSAKTTLVDFAVTTQGLEEQLLGRVILSEKSELEHDRVRLMEAAMENKRRMKHLEDSLLLRLTSTQGSLVDDEDLLNVLHHTKATSQEVREKLTIAAETEQKINAAREEFRPVAVRGSILYFLIVELSHINCMYQTSLKQFLSLFDCSEKLTATSERIIVVNKEMTRVVYLYVSRGLYEKHKFLFAILLALKIDVNCGKITHDQFMTLIKGGASLDLRTVPQKPFVWILDVTWLNLVQLNKIPLFTDLLLHITNNETHWKTWFDLDVPEEVDVEDFDVELNAFHRLLLIRSWCPDRTLSQAKKYVTEALGPEYAQCVLLDLESMWHESNSGTPLICLLSTGSDPTDQIEALAKKNATELKIVSMGQGQEVIARRLLTNGMSQGGWLLLQNCHLSLGFCDEIMDTLMETSNAHPAFRLWVTTEPHPQFSIGLLQMSIKFTNEPPQGIRNSLRQTYAGISQDLLDYTRLRQWQPLLYTVSFLHTVLQERRKYGLGWNIPYDFNQADFSASTQVIQNLLDDMDPRRGVSWVTIGYMLAEVQYGGRVTDDFDKRLLKAYTDIWFIESIFSPNFVFYLNYGLPRCSNHNHYIEFIDTLPVVDSPEVFGLHPNANITYQITTGQDMLDTIVSVQPKDGGGSSSGSETREAVVYKHAQDMLTKLPPDYVPYEVREKLQQMGALLPMNIFLRLEINRMQKVLTIVRTTLQDLRLAIEGTIIMTESLKNTLDAIYDARVPETWKKISWESNTLGFWFTELMERNSQFNNWLDNGRPICFWMTGFFNPQGFLTAMRQEVTRMHRGWALDTVILQNTVTRYTKDDIIEPPAEGVYVYGLLLEGASWDRRARRLIESQPKVLYEEMPVIHMYAINSAASKDPTTYECPVYKKPSRAEGTYICSLDLKTSVSPYHWIFRGVALLCDNK